MPINKDSSQFKQIHEDLQIHIVLGLNNELLNTYRNDAFKYLCWFLDDNYVLQVDDFEYQPYIILFAEVYNAIN